MLDQTDRKLRAAHRRFTAAAFSAGLLSALIGCSNGGPGPTKKEAQLRPEARTTKPIRCRLEIVGKAEVVASLGRGSYLIQSGSKLLVWGAEPPGPLVVAEDGRLAELVLTNARRELGRFAAILKPRITRHRIWLYEVKTRKLHECFAIENPGRYHWVSGLVAGFDADGDHAVVRYREFRQSGSVTTVVQEGLRLVNLATGRMKDLCKTGYVARNGRTVFIGGHWPSAEGQDVEIMDLKTFAKKRVRMDRLHYLLKYHRPDVNWTVLPDPAAPSRLIATNNEEVVALGQRRGAGLPRRLDHAGATVLVARGNASGNSEARMVRKQAKGFRDIKLLEVREGFTDGKLLAEGAVYLNWLVSSGRHESLIVRPGHAEPFRSLHLPGCSECWARFPDGTPRPGWFLLYGKAGGRFICSVVTVPDLRVIPMQLPKILSADWGWELHFDPSGIRKIALGTPGKYRLAVARFTPPARK